MVWDNEINELKQRQKLSKNQGGKESVSKHHSKGRLTIRELSLIHISEPTRPY